MIEFPSDSRISGKLLSVKNTPESGNEDSGFSVKLKEAIEQVNRMQLKADTTVGQVITGEIGIHEGMMALTEADLSLRLMLQVRNKVIDAYKEISHMQF